MPEGRRPNPLTRYRSEFAPGARKIAERNAQHDTSETSRSWPSRYRRTLARNDAMSTYPESDIRPSQPGALASAGASASVIGPPTLAADDR
jgi:hypothetical protein